MGIYVNQFRPRMHLTVEEAARRFGVAPHTLAVAIRRHQLHAKRIAHRSWVTPTAVALFLEGQRHRESAAS
jgi:transposase-like protein